jgi:hypothetical protein
VPGYRYRLYNRDGDEVGVYETLAWNWTVGDVLELPRGGRHRIVKMVDLNDTDDSSGKFQAAFMVEPVQETIIHDELPPKWFCRCERPDGLVWHSLDERVCPFCGDDPDQILEARRRK